ncbi:MAG: LysM peptidoglycan-binding domain-containing protein [Bacteroidota bacterium]
MKLKTNVLFLFLLLSLQFYGQDSYRNFSNLGRVSYLDSIKSTFIHDKLTARVDSLWMKDLVNLDLYNDLSSDIENINIDENVDYELPTALLKERLKKMDEKSPFNIEYNKGLENIIKSFLKNRRKSFERLMAISEYYFPMFEEALSKQNVPLEIKYLAVVESALNPKAVSRVGATGLWQFMYHTGKDYSLDINSYVDERSDPLKSSEAAALYMSNMYKLFGDWDLVLASYNSGPGNVTKAIRRAGGQQNFWNIRKKLPKETQGYVPAFLATMYIYEYHKEHGIVPNRATIKHFATDTVMVRQQISFKQISDLLDIPISQLQLLNPAYKRNIVPYVSGEKYNLRLPVNKIGVYTSNERKIYAYVQHEANKRERPYSSVASNSRNDDDDEQSTVSRTRTYKVKRGDNLSEIANKYDVSVADIKKWNKLRSNRLDYGRSLKIKTFSKVTVAANKPIKKETPTITAPSAIASNEGKKSQIYTVQYGENLKAIAAKFKVSPADIKKWNNLEDNAIFSGIELRIFIAEKGLAVNKEIKQEKKTVITEEDVIVAINQDEGFYIVEKGDNLNNIAKKYNTTTAQIKDWNNLEDNLVLLGTKLRIAPIPPEYKTEEHIVEKGDNLGIIARKYNVTLAQIKEWNNLEDTNIKVGNVLIVSKTEVVPVYEAVAEKTNKNQKFNSKQQQEYYVKKGDSLFSIAKKYPGVSISDIKKWNGINNESLKPGMKLKING